MGASKGRGAAKNERRTNIVAVLGVFVAVALLGVGAVVLWNEVWDKDAIDCEEWEFERALWEDSSTADETARALDRCRSLTGLTETEVKQLLGDPRVAKHRWEYSAGSTNDALGPGDAQGLFVRFERGEVVHVGLAYGGRSPDWHAPSELVKGEGAPPPRH